MRHLFHVAANSIFFLDKFCQFQGFSRPFQEVDIASTFLISSESTLKQFAINIYKFYTSV